MKRVRLVQLAAILIVLLVVVGRAFAADRAHEIGTHAYIYAYPMILMEITRRVSTNVEAPRGTTYPLSFSPLLGDTPAQWTVPRAMHIRARRAAPQ